MIQGGYIIKARCIHEAAIAHCAPVVREVWDWLLLNAKHKPVEYDGYTLKRGQLFCRYDEIREALHWYVGFRKETYTLDQIKKAMKLLRSPPMGSPLITQMKAPRGTVVTILKYSFYQNPKNYESTTVKEHEGTNGSSKVPRPLVKNGKNGKNPPTPQTVTAGDFERERKRFYAQGVRLWEKIMKLASNTSQPDIFKKLDNEIAGKVVRKVGGFTTIGHADIEHGIPALRRQFLEEWLEANGHTGRR